MLLGVDSLDSTRGLVHKFLAVEEMFEMEPGLADRVNFVQASATCCGGGGRPKVGVVLTEDKTNLAAMICDTKLSRHKP